MAESAGALRRHERAVSAVPASDAAGAPAQLAYRFAYQGERHNVWAWGKTCDVSHFYLRLQEYARVHPRLAGAVCMRLGRTYRHLDTRFKLWMLRLHRPRHPAPISDATALNEGADVLGRYNLFTSSPLISIPLSSIACQLHIFLRDFCMPLAFLVHCI